MSTPRVVVVDHYDSYTWNLVHLVASVTGTLPAVVEHDQVAVDDLASHTHVVLSPGPGHPDEPADFMHLMLTLRETEASSYTERDTPIFVGQHVAVREALDALDGRPARVEA